MKAHATYRVAKVTAIVEIAVTLEGDRTDTLTDYVTVSMIPDANHFEGEVLTWRVNQHFAPAVGELVSVKMETTRGA